jgi:DinB superfamily
MMPSSGLSCRPTGLKEEPMRRAEFVLMLVIATGAMAARADAQSTGGANPISTAIRAGWDGAKRNLSRSAELMPEADYGFRPVDSVRTFGQILAHVAGANYVFCSAAKGERPPFEEDAFEKSATTRAQIVKALSDSIAYCDAAYAALDDTRAAQTVEMPFGGGKGARATPLIANTGHLQEHYGNLVTYFRIKGIVPPSSQQ